MGATFSAPSSEAHPTSFTVGTGSFQGVNRPGLGVDYPLPSNAEVKERVELYLYSPLGLRGLSFGDLYLYLTLHEHRNKPGTVCLKFFTPQKCIHLTITREVADQVPRSTSRKDAGSISDGIIHIFDWHNPSERTTALGSAQPVK